MKIIDEINNKEYLVELFNLNDLKNINIGFCGKMVTSEKENLVDNVYAFCKEFMESTGKQNDILKDSAILLLNSLILYQVEFNSNNLNLGAISDFLNRSKENLAEIFNQLPDDHQAKVGYIYFKNDSFNKQDAVVANLLGRFNEIKDIEFYKIINTEGVITELIAVNRIESIGHNLEK